MKGRKTGKRAAAFLLIAGLITGMVTGCAHQPEKEKEPTPKGRYVESEIALPEGAGRPFGMEYGEEGLVLYTSSEDEQEYQSYVYENDTWSSPHKEDWLTDATARLGLHVVDVYSGRDGKKYALAESGQGTHLFTAAEDGTAKDVTPPVEAEQEAAVFSDVVVLKDGTIGIGNYSSTMAEFYKAGEMVFSTEGIQAGFLEEQNMLEASDRTIAVIGQDAASIEFYSAADFAEKNTISTGQDLKDCFLVPGEDGAWYFVNKKGIHRVTEDGSISEMIMDGANGLMSNDVTWFFRRFIRGSGETFYGLYSNADQEWKLMKYAFDKEAAAVREKTLSVYSLTESSTVTLAVNEFKNRYPDVQVEYITAVTGDEMPTADHIRTLNAELLGGSGADVLILDGLPMESYMEKGVLADLSALAGKLEESGVLKNVTEGMAQKDGKIYAVPARVNIPVLFGTKDEIKACESIDSLRTYVQANPDKRLFGVTYHDLIGMTLFHMFYEEMKTENGGISEEKLSSLLSAWMQIGENGKFREYEEKYFESEESVWPYLDKSFCTSEIVPEEENYAEVIEIEGLSATQMFYPGARKTGSQPQDLKGYYVPKVIAGVNASTKQPELSQAFVESLFTETVQQTEVWEGFPVLDSVLETYPDYVESEDGQKQTMKFGAVNYVTGERYEETMTYPTREEMEALITMLKGLTTPFIQNRMISDTVQQEMEKCYAKKKSPEETAKTICQKVDTYLAE